MLGIQCTFALFYDYCHVFLEHRRLFVLICLYVWLALDSMVLVSCRWRPAGRPPPPPFPSLSQVVDMWIGSIGTAEGTSYCFFLSFLFFFLFFVTLLYGWCMLFFFPTFFLMYHLVLLRVIFQIANRPCCYLDVDAVVMKLSALYKLLLVARNNWYLLCLHTCS